MPGVYARVTSALDWIVNITKESNTDFNHIFDLNCSADSVWPGVWCGLAIGMEL